MGLSSKQVSGDQEIENWGQTDFLQSGAAAELQSKPQPTIRRLQQQPPPEAVKCPRCSSTNTKFCYYNNYNKSQPRHFCKSCKRHWTKGGTLRNVPIGGGRKSKRPKLSNPPKTTGIAASTTSTTATAATSLPDNIDNQKSMSDVLYQALFRSSSTLLHDHTTKAATFTGLNNLSASQTNPNTELIQFSALSNTCNLIYPTSYQSFENHYIGNLDSLEESTITTVNINPSSSSGPWAGPDRSGALDLPTDWNWNDIDVLSSADLNISWDDQDDVEIKP